MATSTQAAPVKQFRHGRDVTHERWQFEDEHACYEILDRARHRLAAEAQGLEVLADGSLRKREGNHGQ
jgi:hypothetical protein